MNIQEKEEKKKQIMQELKERGFRTTRQRDLIVNVVLEKVNETPGIQELLSYAQAEDPTIGMATIYRTVEVLVQMGYLSLVDQSEGFNRITLADGGIKIHAFCRNCGKNIDIPEEGKIADIVSELAKQKGFKLLPQAFRICGICSVCQGKMNDEELKNPPIFNRGRGRGRCWRNRQNRD